jgi:hypothetical protein
LQRILKNYHNRSQRNIIHHEHQVSSRTQWLAS